MDILGLTKELIEIDTSPSNRENLVIALNLVRKYLKGFTVEEFSMEGYKSILVYKGEKRPQKFGVILNCHLDIIPGNKSQYKPVEKGMRLYGVGSMDMKSNVACLISSFLDSVEKTKYPLGLQIVTDEEIGGFYGTKHQIDSGVKAKFVISGETTNFNIVNQAKGILWLKICSTGKTAHGAYPWKGNNAIWKMNSFLDNLIKLFPESETETSKSTLNLSSIGTTNSTYNKIPDNCVIKLDIRFAPGEDKEILKNIQTIIPKGFKIETIANESALNVNANNKYLKYLKNVTQVVLKNDVNFYCAHGSSDARHFARKGMPAVEFGPIGGGIGTDKEWIDIPSLHKYTRILNEFLLLT